MGDLMFQPERGQPCPQAQGMVSRGQCNRCNQDLVVRTSYCCKFINCQMTCDWYGDPDHCALARDPEEAKKINPLAPTLARAFRVNNIKEALAADDEKKRAIVEMARINELLNAQLIKPSNVALTQLNVDLHRLLEKYSDAANAEIQFINDGGRRKYNIHAKNLETSTIFEILFAFAGEQNE